MPNEPPLALNGRKKRDRDPTKRHGKANSPRAVHAKLSFRGKKPKEFEKKGIISTAC